MEAPWTDQSWDKGQSDFSRVGKLDTVLELEREPQNDIAFSSFPNNLVCVHCWSVTDVASLSFACEILATNMPPQKEKESENNIDWKADREPEDMPQFLRDIAKKLRSDVTKKSKSGFPKRNYKDCPDALDSVADALDKEFTRFADLQKAFHKLQDDCAQLKRAIAEASGPNPPQDPTTKTKPGPLPHHLHHLITDTTKAVEQGHFRYESHVDLLVASILTHCFPLQHQFYVGPQQTFMTGTPADKPMIEIANSWSMCVDAADTTRASSDQDHSGFAKVPFLDGLAAISTPKSKGLFAPRADAQEDWDDVDDVLNLTNTSPHPSVMNSPSSSSSAAPVVSASTTPQVPPSGSRTNPSLFGASPAPPGQNRLPSQLGFAQVWDVDDLFPESPDHAVPNLVHAPPPPPSPNAMNPPAQSSSSSSAAPAAASTARQMPPSGSQVNPAVQDGSFSQSGSAPVTLHPPQPGIEPELSQHEVPSFNGSMPAIPRRLSQTLKSFIKDPPSDLSEWLAVDDAGRYILNKSGRAQIKRPDFRVGLLESIKEQMFKNLVIVEDKLPLELAAVVQLLGYMEDLEQGGGNRLALGLAVVFTANYELKVAMFRREKEDEPIKNIGGTYEHINGKPHVQFKWYALNSVEVREQLLKIWQEEMEVLGSVRSP
ncbi:hypothetical protein BDZ89DRAFT_1111717 [Hymenopellis radicata]|nr:hypothetical protein BDZ89DRAFT_1111717 [Hymenopellis radicata]